MKHNAKKILAMLLTLVMVLSLVPAAAAGGIPDRQDIDVLMYELYILAYEKYAEDYEAHNELLNAQDALFVAYVIQAEEKVTDDVVAAYNSALAVYRKYTATVPVKSITLNQQTITVKVGELQDIVPEITPNDATDQTVIWSSSDESVATVADGDVTGVAPGTAIITATATNGTADTADDIAATCTVTVTAKTYTVTYIANNDTNEKVVEDNRAAGDYIIQAYDKNFTVPDGKVFDYWKGSDDGKYKDEQTIQLTDNLTLTAQWKEEKKPDGDEKKTGGSGSGFDLVFNIPGEDNSWGYGGGYAPQQAYRVSLAPMQGGSAALGLTTGESTETAMNVYPTTTVYVFPNAEQGYVLDKIVWSLIDGSASYDITEAKNFVMPAMDVVVYVTFKPVG